MGLLVVMEGLQRVEEEHGVWLGEEQMVQQQDIDHICFQKKNEKKITENGEKMEEGKHTGQIQNSQVADRKLRSNCSPQAVAAAVAPEADIQKQNNQAAEGIPGDSRHDNSPQDNSLQDIRDKRAAEGNRVVAVVEDSHTTTREDNTLSVVVVDDRMVDSGDKRPPFEDPRRAEARTWTSCQWAEALPLRPHRDALRHSEMKTLAVAFR